MGDADVNAATAGESEGVECATFSHADVSAAQKNLSEWRDAVVSVKRETRAAEKSKRVEGLAGSVGVVVAEVTDDAEPRI